MGQKTTKKTCLLILDLPIWVHRPNLSLSTDVLISVYIKKKRLIIEIERINDCCLYTANPTNPIPILFGAAIPTPFRTATPTVYPFNLGHLSLFVECLLPVWSGLNGFVSGFLNLNNVLVLPIQNPDTETLIQIDPHSWHWIFCKSPRSGPAPWTLPA